MPRHLHAQLGRATVMLCVTALTLQPLGCSRLAPQLQPTDVAALEKLEDIDDREEAYAENQLYVERGLGKTRYRKGTHPNAPAVQWQSLDSVLRSDGNSAATLPSKKKRTAVVLAALAGMSAVVAVGGVAATAREGFDANSLDGGGALLLGGAVLTLGFTVAAGLVYGSMRRDYEKAVSVYNDSLGMRMGLLTPDGRRIVRSGLKTDDEGFILTDDEGGEGSQVSSPGAEEREGPARSEPGTEPAGVDPVNPVDGAESPSGDSGTASDPDPTGGVRAGTARTQSPNATAEREMDRSKGSDVDRASSTQKQARSSARGLSARDTVGASL